MLRNGKDGCNDDNAEWCNGSTADSDSVSRGSNPFSVVITEYSLQHDAEWCNGSTADSDSVSRGSNPFSVVDNEVWLSLVERYVRDVEVAGSNPVTSIEKGNPRNRVPFYF